MKQITVTVPVPPNVLSPNGRGVWPQRARAAKAVRADAGRAAREAMGPRWWEWDTWRGRVWVTIRWCAPGRMPDLDNAAARCKPALDGIVDAGLMADDNQVAGMRIERGPVDGRPRVELVLTHEAPGG